MNRRLIKSMRGLKLCAKLPIDIKIKRSSNEEISLGFEGIRDNRIFFIGYSSWLIVALLRTTMVPLSSTVATVVYVFSTFCFVLGEVKHFPKYEIYDWIFLLVLLVLNVQTYIFGANNLALISMLLFTCRTVSFKSILQVTTVIDLLILIGIPLCSAFGIIESVTDVRVNGTVRTSLGFAYVTYGSYVLFNLILCFLALNTNDSRKYFISWVVLLGFNTLLLVTTDSRNGCLLSYVALIIGAAVRFSKKRDDRPWVRMIVINIFGICFVGFSICILLYLLFPESQCIQRLDQFFSARLTYTTYALNQFGIPLIGGTTIDLVSNGLVIDCSYFRIIFEHGLIVLAVVLFGLWILQKRLIDDGYIILAMCLAFVALHSTFDAQLISVQHNVFILLLAYLLPSGASMLFNKTKRNGENTASVEING